MNFMIEETKPGLCTVTTETRVYATDSAARQRFAAYWRTIYPGSALIRSYGCGQSSGRQKQVEVSTELEVPNSEPR